MSVPTSDIEAAASAWIARRDAGMTAAEDAEFARWAADPRHAAALARHEQTWKIFDRPVNAGEGRALAHEFRARFAQQSRRRRTTATLAAVSCLLVAGVVWRSTIREQTEPAPGANAIVVLPEKRMLPDGSVVELKPGAEIEIDYSEQFRRVYLRKGEAHYEVAKNTARPFIVDVAGVEVRAVGTAFSVERGPEAVTVLVTEGRVAVGSGQTSDVRGQTSEVGSQTSEVRRQRAGEDVESASVLPPGHVSVSPRPRVSASSPAPSLPHALTPTLIDAGHRLVVELAAGPDAHRVAVPVSGPEVAERLAWRAPRLEFTGARLAEAIALMNRYNRAQFVIDDPSLADLEVSGYFRADNYETFLSLIEQGLGLKSERDGDKILLRKAL